MTIIGNDHFGYTVEPVRFDVNGDCAGLRVQAVPHQFDHGTDRVIAMRDAQHVVSLCIDMNPAGHPNSIDATPDNRRKVLGPPVGLDAVDVQLACAGGARGDDGVVEY
ncbi:Uncharacterised protein [Mycobacteroides abscessus subsp. bolletii]|nr:Uncharacterised protein [Mycobacteroides abscessus subsp. bolletii]